jgi:hypothetical protein
MEDILVLVFLVECIGIVDNQPEPCRLHLVLELKLQMQLDVVTPQADVVDANRGIPEGQRESEAIDIKANRLRQVAGPKNRLNPSERCPRHKSLIVRLRAGESSPFRDSPRYPSAASPVQAMFTVSLPPTHPGRFFRFVRPLRRWRDQITFVPSNLGWASWQADITRSMIAPTATICARVILKQAP